MISAIDQAGVLGYKVVVFTGGEATLVGSDLTRAIKRANLRGMSTRLVTNAYWATSLEEARRRTTSLAEAGLAEINYSTGDQHSRFVPLENVIRATRAALEASLNVSVMVELVGARKITKATVEGHPEFQSVVRDFPGKWVNVHESPWMPLSDLVVSRYPDGVAINRSTLSATRGCNSVLSTTTVEADGVIGACCGLGMRLIPELQLGTEDTTTLADADRRAADDFLKRWIRVEGPAKILAWAAEIDPEIKWENMYAHRCQACLRLYKDPRVRKVVREHHFQKLADVIFSEWLLYHYTDSAKV